jgi:hypothetical protein
MDQFPEPSIIVRGDRLLTEYNAGYKHPLRVESHTVMPAFVWVAERVGLHQCSSGATATGLELFKQLEDVPVLNACVLDFLLSNPEHIPQHWAQHTVAFWGTIYRACGDCLYVRVLYISGEQWCDNVMRLTDNVWPDVWAAVRKS